MGEIEQRARDDADGRSAVLSALGLSVGYGSPVCPDLDLAVRAGEVVAVVGANGAGKSTLLRTLAGRQAPLAGTVHVFGRPVDERSAEFRRHAAVELGTTPSSRR